MNNSVVEYRFNELSKAYPYQFKNVIWGLPQGWYSLAGIVCGLIDEMLEKAGYLEDKRKSKVFGGWAVVKDKFAGLRMYCYFIETFEDHTFRDELYSLIQAAEDMSYRVCQECGKRGDVRASLRWHQTLCDHHYKIAMKKGKGKDGG